MINLLQEEISFWYAYDMKKFDVIFIGGGPGGYVGAIKAALLGLKTALVEKEHIGGTCLIRGCIPTKTLISNASVMEMIQKSQEFGIHVDGNVSVDYKSMKERKDQVVSTLASGVKNLVKVHGVEIFSGIASFTDKNTVKVLGETPEVLQADSIVIATGSSSVDIPPCPVDRHRIHDSTSILELTTLPKSLIVVGGGYIGCEFASLFHALGTQVTIVEALPKIVMTQGENISSFLTKTFEKKGITLRTNVAVTKSTVQENHVEVELGDNSRIDAEMVLVAVGRKPFTEGLCLEKAGLSPSERGFIEVDDGLETAISGIYAIGDVTGKSMLAHVASHQAIVAAKRIHGSSVKMDYASVPAVIFTHPEIATVGYNLEQAKEKGYPAKSSVFPLSMLGKAQASMDTDGFFEVTFDPQTLQILGASVVGHEAGNMIAEMGVAIQNELTLDCIADTIHPHPTLSEGWMELAHIGMGSPIHSPP